MPDPERRPIWSWWYLLFLAQLVAVLWPPFYNSVEPRFIGIPFFYWYQLLWVIVGAILTVIVYFITDHMFRPPRDGSSERP
jgi:Protein of unknown function (DUF3311)